MSEPLIDLAALTAEVDTIAIIGADPQGARQKLVKRLKAALVEARKEAERRLIDNRDGRACAASLCDVEDELIGLITRWVTTRLYPSDNPSSGEKMAIVATGGYGRGLLAPGSDIDLLFLLPYKQTAWGESVAEAILYCLWDLGQKVGHATRSVDECIRQAREDLTIRTALMEARLLIGDKALFDDLLKRFDAEVSQGTEEAFIAAKLHEREERHNKAGQSRYLVEPNVKDGKGGLRDLHTFFWIAKDLYHVRRPEQLAATGVFTAAELTSFRRAERFLWTVRCHMHFLTGRAEERLSFDLQPEVAARLGYSANAGGMKKVERFMRHYFLVAKEVGDLTAILCAAIEARQAKPLSMFNRLVARLRAPGRHALKESKDFHIEHHRLVAHSDKVFADDPVNFIRMFRLADQHELELHPALTQLARRSLKLISDDLRANAEANRLFRAIVTDSRAPEATLRRMNEVGVLGRFITDFGKIVALMQFSLYHHYTVDEHLIRSVGALQEIASGRNEQLGVAVELIKSIQPQNRAVLYMAMFLHDIAKGRPEDHSIAGAKIARKLGPRFGFSASETETMAWLIEQHLTMSTISQSRDLADRKTIETFAKIVQSLERMKLLTILTTADIHAVGPAVWTGWKSQLLRTLYYETEPALTGGFSEIDRARRVAMAQDDFRHEAPKALPELTGKALEQYIVRHYPSYWLKMDMASKIAHARFLLDAERDDRKLYTHVETDAQRGVTDLTVLAPDHPRLLSIIAGACAAAGGNIVSAQIHTTADGFALDTISVSRAYERDEDELRRAKRIADTIEATLTGAMRIGEQVAAARAKPAARQQRKTFQIPPEVHLHNSWSNRFSVIEIASLDRPGLLHDLTATISRLNLNIGSAHISTFGEKALDVFYVTDLMGAKIETPQRQAAIRRALMSALEPDEE